MNERLEGLAIAYEEDKSIMRFRTYNPIRVSGEFQKFAAEVVPYTARDDLHGRNIRYLLHKMK